MVYSMGGGSSSSEGDGGAGLAATEGQAESSGSSQKLRQKKARVPSRFDNVVDEEEQKKLAEEIFNSAHEVDPNELVHRSEHIVNAVDPDQKTMIFHHYLKGKSGEVIEDMLLAHAYAFHHGYVYGGSCGEIGAKKDQHEALLDAIGLKEVLPFSCPADHRGEDDIGRKSVIPREDFHQDDTRTWTPLYVDHLKELVRYPPKEPDVYTIVVHIRRNDITPCRPQHHGYDRYLPNLHYLNLIEKYHQPGARVVVFSQSKSYEPLDVFEEKGYEVLLDSDMSEIWKTIIVSDVVILSRSDFSLIPSIVARGTIVYTPFWHIPLRNWERVDSEQMELTDAETKRLQESCPKTSKFGGETFHKHDAQGFNVA